jgi:trehalose-6-phosphatase
MIYLGDDLTDEDAFRALPADGVGVLVREQYRPTAADFWVVPPEGLLKLLSRFLSELSENSEREER